MTKPEYMIIFVWSKDFGWVSHISKCTSRMEIDQAGTKQPFKLVTTHIRLETRHTCSQSHLATSVSRKTCLVNLSWGFLYVRWPSFPFSNKVSDCPVSQSSWQTGQNLLTCSWSDSQNPRLNATVVSNVWYISITPLKNYHQGVLARRHLFMLMSYYTVVYT